MPKITKSDAKLSEILYERNEWHLFPGHCNLQFLSTKVLQGSVGTCINYGRIFINFFTANLLRSVTVKEFWKSVSISRSYRQKLSGTFFSGHSVYTNLHPILHCYCAVLVNSASDSGCLSLVQSFGMNP